MAENNIKPKAILFFKSLYLNDIFFGGIALLSFLGVFAFIWPAFFVIVQLSVIAFIVFFAFDLVLLYKTKAGLIIERTLPEKLSNGDDNSIVINVKSNYTFDTIITIIDEIPIQFQVRDFEKKSTLRALDEIKYTYQLRPTERGEYHFGCTLVYVKSKLGLISRQYNTHKGHTVKTYPSFIQLKKFDFISLNFFNPILGLKKIRKIGNSFEFEQIKDYTQGDNIKDINWKATAKKNSLMVNQFQDERSQQVYSIIDKGRVMKMPFNGLSLLDYAINASLVISSVVLRKHDKAGLFSFSKDTKNFVAAERRNSQMNLILESLYNVDTDFFESDYSNLYGTVKRKINQRSLLLLYTNFESLDAVHRQLKYLRAINKNHVLVVVFFENTELEKMTKMKATSVQEVFDKTIANQFAFEKKLIVSELNKYGIQTILTAPHNLSIDVINKYLEIKSKGFI